MPKILGYPFRAYMIHTDKKRMKKLPHYEEGFKTISDIRYEKGAGKFHKFDLIIPDGKDDEITPVVIDIHGGAYYFGYKWINDDIARYFAIHSGYKVVNANYRIVGFGTNMFDGIKDVVKMIEYVYAHADELKIDKNNIFIMGDSAGAHIMSLAATCFYNQEYAKALGIEIKEPVKFNAAAFTCGVYSFDPFLDTWYLRPFLKDITHRKLNKGEKYKLSQVMENYIPGSFPIILNSAYGDFLKKQTKTFYEFLKDKNEVKLIFYDESLDGVRKLEHVYNVMFPFYEESIQTNNEICDFFKAYIK